VRGDLDLCLPPCREIRSVRVKARGSHLALRSDQINLRLDPDGITFGVDIELYSETEWPEGDVCGNSQSYMLFERFG